VNRKSISCYFHLRCMCNKGDDCDFKQKENIHPACVASALKLGGSKRKAHLKVRFTSTECFEIQVHGTNLSEYTYTSSKDLPYVPAKFSLDSKWLNKCKVSVERAKQTAHSWRISLYPEEKKSEIKEEVEKEVETQNKDSNSSDSDSDCSPAENIRKRWIADTGSGYDLIGENYIGGDFNVQEGKRIKFQTAGGRTGSSEYVDIKIGKLDETAKPIILEHTPPVLTIGRRAMEKGFDFYWPPKSNLRSLITFHTLWIIQMKKLTIPFDDTLPQEPTLSCMRASKTKESS